MAGISGLPQPLRDLGANLRAAPMLLAARDPARVPLRPGLAQLLLLSVLYLALEVAYDMVAIGLRDGHFDPLAVPFATFRGLAALASAGVLALATRGLAAESPARPVGDVATLLATAAFSLACAGSMLASLLAFLADASATVDNAYGVLAWVPVGWVALAYALAAARICVGEAHPPVPVHAWRVARLGAFALSFALALLPQWFVDSSLRIWTAQDASEREAAAGAGAPQSEQTLYGQFDLLQDALDAIEPGDPGVPELYSVTFGGDGSQDVFLNEAQGAGAVLSDVFGGAGHGIVLANSHARAQEVPFATASALQRTLAAMAERMHPDTDVLALVLTSHGTPDHRLSVSLPPYRFEDLTPERLRELLDESGIRFRVVIVSACYSGGFLEPLASPDTLVITASAADRTSFGCRDGAKWTDFGRAFFAEALRRTGSFESAFRIAEQDIAAREARERVEPSHPQIFVGTAIREALQRLHTHRGEAVLASAQALRPVR
jgi:hypothetical protein